MKIDDELYKQMKNFQTEQISHSYSEGLHEWEKIYSLVC